MAKSLDPNLPTAPNPDISWDLLSTANRIGHCPKCAAVIDDGTAYPELDFSQWCPVCGWESETAEEMTKRRGPKNYISYMGEDRY